MDLTRAMQRLPRAFDTPWGLGAPDSPSSVCQFSCTELLGDQRDCEDVEFLLYVRAEGRHADC